MGAQQILLLILSIIIIGTTIVVGIILYQDQAYAAAKAALSTEAKDYASKFWNSYQSLAGQKTEGSVAAFPDTAQLGKYVGWDSNYRTTEVGTFSISAVSDTCVNITGSAQARKKDKSPKVTVTITLPEGKISVVENEVVTK